MILSRNFVKDYIDLDDDLSIKKIGEDMTTAGNEYDVAQKFINCTKLVIGEIIECNEHPDSDHLHVCKVNIGKEVLQIVCGAPNARKGIKVIVAMPGAKLPGGEIKAGTIRGQESNGMMCSIAELGVDKKFLNAEDIEGIAELDSSAIPGEDPIKYLGWDDEIIDFELTPDRGDLLSIIGMAYELGAIYDKKVKKIEYKYNEYGEDINNQISLRVDTDNCTMFLAKKVENVKIKESPAFIKNRLMACGIRPINNVVDISNYVMLELGQPLHFYDADNLGNTIVVRMANEKEKLVTLDNQERILDENDIVIATNEKAVGLAGVMGGLDTEVVNETKNVIIESAIFDGVRVRKTSKKIVRSEASNRFEKGLDPKKTYMAIDRACELLEKYADGNVRNGMCKYDITNSDDKKIKISYKTVNDVLGSKISNKEILDVFRKLGFSYEAGDEEVVVNAPSRRQDISIKEDLIEEVSRIYGVDNIEGTLPTMTEKQNDYDNTIRSIRDKMIGLGLSDTLEYILINDKNVHKYTTDEFEELRLLDPITEERNTLRYSLLYSLKQIYDYNSARNNNDISIFEIGKSFYKEDGIYKENNNLAILMSGNYYDGLNKKNVNFYILKGIVEECLDFLGFNGRYSLDVKGDLPKELHPGVSANIIVQGMKIGIIGKLHPSVSKKDIFVFEINLDKLLSLHPTRMTYKDIPKFPSIEKDLAFVVDKNITSLEIEKVIKKTGGKLLTDINVFDVYVGNKVGNDKKSIAYNLTFRDNNRTLTEDEVMLIFNNIIRDVENKLNASVRDK